MTGSWYYANVSTISFRVRLFRFLKEYRACYELYVKAQALSLLVSHPLCDCKRKQYEDALLIKQGKTS